MAKGVRATFCVAATTPHGSTTSCLVSVAPLFGRAMCHPQLLLFPSLGGVIPVQLAQVFSVELRAQAVIWQCGSPLACACGESSWRQHPLLSCSAVLLSSSWGSLALWIHLPWGCRTGFICSCLWHWRSGVGVDRRAGGGFFPSPSFSCRKSHLK